MTISSYIIGKHGINRADFQKTPIVKEEIGENQEALWIHANDPLDVVRLEPLFDLDPLTGEAVVKRNQHSKIEDHGTYEFTNIEGVQKQEEGEVRRMNTDISSAFTDTEFNEEELYIFLELKQRWIITVNYNKNFHTNIDLPGNRYSM